MPASSAFKPRLDYSKLSSAFSHGVRPADFPETRLRFWNDRWAQRLGLGELTTEEKTLHFARFKPFAGAQPEPLAMKYHGHQFRHYNPQLGDGRGFLFSQAEDLVDGRLLDFGTKGSGQTPYSRAGDGRLTLKGAVREALATEMLEALGVNTSKTFCFFETGEALERGDEPSPTRSAVLTRLSHGHIRYGTFQRLAVTGEKELMRELVDYSVRVFFPNLISVSAEEKHFLMLERIVAGAADLAASWMIAGFVHGVLNTDNLNITGESFDYGPWRFLPRYEPEFTAAYFDHEGLYSYARQPEAVYWNLDQLARSLHVMVQVGQETAWHDRFVSILEQFPIHFQRCLIQKFFLRLGFECPIEKPTDEAFGEELFTLTFKALGESKVGFENFFYDWYGGSLRSFDKASANVGLNRDVGHISDYNSSNFSELTKLFDRLLRKKKIILDKETPTRLSSDYYRRGRPETILIEEVENIWSSIDQNDDWSAFDLKIAAMRERGRIHGYGTSAGHS